MSKFVSMKTNPREINLAKITLLKVIVGDFNIDRKEVQHQIPEKLNNFSETFGLPNLAKDYTCYFKSCKLSIDLILAIKVSSFQITNTTETDISKEYNLISTNYSSEQSVHRV